MEINSLGLINMDDYRLSSLSGVRGPQNSNFADILERVRSFENREQGTEQRAFTPSGIDKNDELYQLCLELETFIVKNLINGMRNTVPKSGFIDDSFAGKMYEDMLYDEYAKVFTRNAGFGLAEQAYRQLRSLQG
jgi:flagellar protein FlgJ